jgi:hypothetical protein
VNPIKRFSVSMLTTFGTPDKPSCKRKMAFNYLTEGMKSPPSAAQQRGIELHDTLEKIAKQGPFEIPEKHKIYVKEVQAQEHLPAPGENALIEHWMTMPTQFGIPFVGKIDLVRYQTEPPRLIDWKTMGDARYMLTPAEIADDVQTNVYARYLFEEGLSEPLTGGLIYIEMPKTPPKRKAKVISRLIDITKRQSTMVWDSIQPVLEEMLEVAERDSPNDVEPNTAICSKYGGCPFRGECGIPMFATLGQPKHQPEKRKDSEMGFADKLKAKQNGTPTPEVKAAPVPTVTAAPTKAAPTKAAPAAAPTFTEKMRARKAAAAEGLATVAAVVPPDAPPRDSGGADPLPVEVKDEAAQDDANVEAETGKKKRGRPQGSTAKKGLIIYVDCMVTKGGGDVEATTLEDFWGPIDMELNQAATEAGKASWWDFSFSEQKGAIAIKVQERIAKGLPHAIVAMRSSNFLMSDVLPLLIPHAVQVVRRF